MTLPTLPGDYAPGDRPTAEDLNAIKDHAGYHIDRLTTVLKRTGTVQNISNNVLSSANAVSWNGIINGRNGLGWVLTTPTRIPIPAGADGRYSVVFSGEFTANATGKRYTALGKNGTFIQPGLFAVGDASLTSFLASAWETEVVGGDYLEVWLYQNSGGTLSLTINGEAPQVAIRRLD